MDTRWEGPQKERMREKGAKIPNQLKEMDYKTPKE